MHKPEQFKHIGIIVHVHLNNQFKTIKYTVNDYTLLEYI